MSVEFYVKQCPVTSKPDAAMESVEYVRIDVEPGHTLTRPATDADRHRWKAEYAAFKAPPKVNPHVGESIQEFIADEKKRDPEFAEALSKVSRDPEPKKSVLGKVFKKSK